MCSSREVWPNYTSLPQSLMRNTISSAISFSALEPKRRRRSVLDFSHYTTHVLLLSFVVGYLVRRRASTDLQHFADSQIHLVQPHASRTPVSQIKRIPREGHRRCKMDVFDCVDEVQCEKMTSDSSGEENGVLDA